MRLDFLKLHDGIKNGDSDALYALCVMIAVMEAPDMDALSERFGTRLAQAVQSFEIKACNPAASAL